jgi:hypothetical protein
MDNCVHRIAIRGAASVEVIVRYVLDLCVRRFKIKMSCAQHHEIFSRSVIA